VRRISGIEQVRVEHGIVLYAFQMNAEKIEGVNCGFVIVDRFRRGCGAQDGTEFAGGCA
jgi:hypothetical protein